MNEFRIDAAGGKQHWWTTAHTEAEILAIGFSIDYSVRRDREGFLLAFIRLIAKRNAEVLNIRHSTMLEF